MALTPIPSLSILAADAYAASKPCPTLSESAGSIAIESINPENREKIPNAVKQTLKNRWDYIKIALPNSQVLKVMTKIENQVIHRLRSSRVTPDPKLDDRILEKNVDILFKKLAEHYQFRGLNDGRIPTDPVSYVKIHGDVQPKIDQANRRLLIEVMRQVDGSQDQQPQNIEQINLAFEDHNNSGILNQVEVLNLTSADVIPSYLAKFKHIRGLSLYNNKVRWIPDWIGDFSQLKQLDLSGNEITIIPNSIGNLTNLKCLRLALNKIKEIPESIGNLTNLQILDFSFCNIEKLPDSIASLAMLEMLLLWDNKISNPLLESVCSLTRLTELDLSNTKIKKLPETIGHLTNLRGLSLATNDIAKLPKTIGDLTNLRALRLGYAHVLEVPESIGNLTNLETLSIRELEKSLDLPESICNLRNLKKLDLHGNEIKFLPDAIGNLKNLKEIDIGMNALRILPQSFGNLQLKNFQMFCSELGTGSNFILQRFFMPHTFSFIMSDNSDLYNSDSIFLENLECILQKMNVFREYICLSEFSKLCKLIMTNDDGATKEAFKRLKIQDKNLIFECLYNVYQKQYRTNDFLEESKKDPQWGEHHIFEDMEKFCKAVSLAVDTKFTRLSKNQKDAVYGKIYELAGRPKVPDSQWGERHAFDEVLRLVDAMDTITS